MKENIENNKEKITKYKCNWKVGDTFAYKLENQYAKENGFLNRYIIMQKVDEVVWNPEHILPILRAKISVHNRIPNTRKEIEQLEYIQVGYKKPDILGEKQKNEVRKLEILPEYVFDIMMKDIEEIPKKLIYIGNYQNINLPSLEFIPKCKIDIVTLNWKTLETVLLLNYLGYNKGKFPEHNS